MPLGFAKITGLRKGGKRIKYGSCFVFLHAWVVAFGLSRQIKVFLGGDVLGCIFVQALKNEDIYCFEFFDFLYIKFLFGELG